MILSGLEVKKGDKGICCQCNNYKTIWYPSKGLCGWCYEKTKTNYLERYEAKHLKQRYGISIIQREEMLKQQNYSCAICFIEAKLYVDHCHKTNKIRGMLCNECNLFLGKIEKDVNKIERFINYIEAAKHRD